MIATKQYRAWHPDSVGRGDVNDQPLYLVKLVNAGRDDLLVLLVLQKLVSRSKTGALTWWPSFSFAILKLCKDLSKSTLCQTNLLRDAVQLQAKKSEDSEGAFGLLCCY